MKFFLQIFVIAFCCGRLGAAPQAPSPDELVQRIRPGHPRLFLTEEQLGAFRERANTVCREDLRLLRKRVDRLSGNPQLTGNAYAEVRDGKIIFKRKIGDQLDVRAGLVHAGGFEALECAIAYLASGEEPYLRKAIAYLKLCTEYCAVARRSRIMPEWYHVSRLAALVAYDWLYNNLTPEERRNFIGPMLEYIDFMRKPGYHCNAGGITTGFYGEPGLVFFAGLAGFGDGIDDARAEKLLREGYSQYVKLMDFRDRISAGSGLLSSICVGYSFGYYPHASFNFLHALRSGAGVDGTKIWTQMRDFANYFDWMAIPTRDKAIGFLEYGWGDALHISNAMPMDVMYTHFAQCLHFYGENPDIRRMLNAVPEKCRRLTADQYPYLPYILFGFEPIVPQDPPSVQEKPCAAFFPAYGLLSMRSGNGPDDTYATFKGGASEEQHQHLDELSFIIYKKGFQALDTGGRGDAPHHLVYYPQTIAHNSLLIRMKDEPLARHWYPTNAPKIDPLPFADGGQNSHRKARSLGIGVSARHAAAAADATASYSAAKCRQAVREFVFIKPDYFVVYDRLESVNPDQQKVFLWHSANEPQFVDGIWRGEVGDGALLLRTLLPETVHTQVIGGPGREFLTNGKNYPQPEWVTRCIRSLKQGWTGAWRLEIAPAQAETAVRFLTVMQVGDRGMRHMVPSRLLRDAASDGVEWMFPDGERCRVRFLRNAPGGEIEFSRNGKVNLRMPLYNGKL